jgi:lysozyme
MKFSLAGKKALGEMEGCKLEMYLDSGGAPSIGIGHLLTKLERTSGKIVIGTTAVDYREELTEQQCWQLLDQDLSSAESAVNQAIKVPLNQNQYDALVSFTFNVGNQAFAGSTLLRLLNLGQYDQVPTQLARWNKDNGQVVQGLINRRNKEIALWAEETQNAPQT